MALTKRQYIDGETIITAQNLNDIQDEVIAHETNKVPTTRTVNSKALSSNITLNASDVGAVPTTRTVNSKALSSNITLSAADVGAVPTSRKVNSKALSADITLTAADVSAVPTSRTINSKALSSNITLSAADVGAAPTDHASTATTYGKGTSSNYGHVKLSSSAYSTLGESDGTAATPSAIHAAQANFAPMEDTSTASRAYAAGEYVLYKGDLYAVTAAIASGASFTSNNLRSATIGGRLTAIERAATNVSSQSIGGTNLRAVRKGYVVNFTGAVGVWRLDPNRTDEALQVSTDGGTTWRTPQLSSEMLPPFNVEIVDANVKKRVTVRSDGYFSSSEITGNTALRFSGCWIAADAL